ncbi:hypothetical protein FJZ36_10320 [Candidatus Poribacteria bacterium]|nr:hypothetical protein [Candidatus Poribacteria bacterium]
MTLARSVGVIAALVLSVATLSASAEDAAPTSKVSGYGYLDYFNNVAHPDPDSEGLDGFRMRRLYLTYDYSNGAAYKARVRLESNDGSLFLQPDAVSGAKSNPDKSLPSVFVKDAYLQWKIESAAVASIHPSIIAGIQPTPAFSGIEEDAWKYRALEKTPLDLRGIASSRDMGISIRGDLDKALGVKGFGYWLMVGNDSTKPETNKQQRFYGLATYQRRGLAAEAFADWRQRPNDGSQNTVKVTGGYGTERAGLYATLFQQWARVDASAPSHRASGVSVFGRYAISKAIELVGRGDVFDPDRDANDDARTLILGGVAYRPFAQLHVIPNVVVERDGSDDPAATARLTFWFQF